MPGVSSDTFITASDPAKARTALGLGNVDDTRDVDKPVSTAQQAAINAATAALVNGAPGALDTLNELAAALGDDANFAATTAATIAAKYTKPSSGIPESDLASAAHTKLNYDRARNAYNWKQSNTRRLRNSLLKATNGGEANHLFIGDSDTAAYVAPSGGGAAVLNAAAAWPIRYRSALKSVGIPIAGTGWVGTNDPRWAFSAGWTDGAGQYRYTATNGSTATFTSDLPGTSIAVATLNNAGPFTVSVDGGAPVTVTGDGSTTMKVYQVNGLANTIHTVVVTATTTGTPATYVMKAACWTPNGGLRVHNEALGSWKATDWNNFTSAGAGTQPWQLAGNGANGIITAPDVVHIALGGDDLLVSESISTITTNLTAIRNQFPNSDCILYLYPQINTSPAHDQWDALAAALYTLADTLDVPLIDLYDRYGSYTTANANGFMAGDQVHLTATVHQDWGRNVGLLAAATISGTPFDANQNLPVNNIIAGFETITATAGTTQLTVANARTQVVAGPTTHTVKLPAAVTPGMEWEIINTATGAVTVQGSGGNTIIVLPRGASMRFRAMVAAPTAADWYYPQQLPNAIDATDAGYIAWAFDPATCFGQTVLAAGFLYLMAVPIRRPCTVTNVHVGVGTAGATLTSGQNFAALYSPALALLSVSADQTTAFGSTGRKDIALTTPQAVTPGIYYVGVVANGTTPPALAQAVSAGAAGSINYNLAALKRTTTGGSGITTTLPGTATLGSTSALQLWAGVS